jgi:tetratricopeptide (TPR) repeat protein
MVAEARALAESDASTIRLLLFARIDPDRDRARETLKRAAAADRRSPWPRYALAHLEARAGSWSEAQRHLDLALDLNPDHAPSRRLEAALYARAGRSDRAIDALSRWLAATRDGAGVDPAARAAARLDLAQLHLLDGEDAKALAVLRDVEGEPINSPRALALLAAVEQARGNPERALEAARAGERADPSATLPLVQQALLYEHHLGDAAAARAAWQRVLDVAGKRSDLAALVAIVRARVALERAEADAARSKP